MAGEKTKTDKIAEAIVFLEEAIKEAEAIRAECSPALAAELAKQNTHFRTAVKALRVAELIQTTKTGATLGRIIRHRLRQKNTEPSAGDEGN